MTDAERSRHKREFQDQGFTVRRRLFSPKEVAATVREIERAQTREAAPSELDKGGLKFKHNIHQGSSYLQAFISQEKVVEFLAPIIGPDIWVRWDQGISKIQGAPEFPWHQDNGYNRLKQGHFQLWVALSGINTQTGLLWLQPGSHKLGVLAHSRNGTHQVGPSDATRPVSVEAEPGDVILFSSLMLHRTDPNVSDNPRLVYVVEYMALDQIDPYIPPPYFIAARGGRSRGEFVSQQPGMRSAKNRLLYMLPLLGQRFPALRSAVHGTKARLRGSTR
jgi:ectoine hydroxylase-related dioxygenase (phytanoyl-CoA dioxygenase family)